MGQALAWLLATLGGGAMVGIVLRALVGATIAHYWKKYLRGRDQDSDTDRPRA